MADIEFFWHTCKLLRFFESSLIILSTPRTVTFTSFDMSVKLNPSLYISIISSIKGSEELSLARKLFQADYVSPPSFFPGALAFQIWNKLIVH